MKRINWAGFAFLLLISIPVSAFDSVDEQIDHYLGVLASNDHKSKVHMLKRLKWKAISDPRLYDEIEKSPASMYLNKKFDKITLGDIGHKIRAPGYSGNPKYRATLETIFKDAPHKKLRGYAKKALVDLDRFVEWNKLTAESDAGIEGKSIEITTYSKMLNTNDTAVQRFAASAIFDEKQQDSDLLDLVAEKLKTMYTRPGLDGRDAPDWHPNRNRVRRLLQTGLLNGE